jgi:hypothetical protein
LGDEDTRDSWARWVGEPDPGKLESHGFTLSKDDLEDECVRAIGYRRVVRLLIESGYVAAHQVKAVGSARSLVDLTAADVVRVCRKYKIEAAAALTQFASPTELRTIDSVSKFVRGLCA